MGSSFTKTFSTASTTFTNVSLTTPYDNNSNMIGTIYARNNNNNTYLLTNGKGYNCRYLALSASNGSTGYPTEAITGTVNISLDVYY